ncbi:MAG: ATP-dependent Clp protease adaptor ClpS [Promethearchaeota archaeon]|jgi:ATP-dependent Clp protease adaptor protein ClpS
MTTTSPTCEVAPPAKASLPPWKVILHNDNVNIAEDVVQRVQEIMGFDEERAIELVIEAHETGQSLLLTTHHERAELYMEQFQSCNITVTIERA